MKEAIRKEAQAWGDTLLVQLRTRPVRSFWIGLLAYCGAWWIAQVLTQKNLPLDAVEMLTWGREWQLAYWKHPPLPAWVLDLLYRIGGPSEPLLYLASPLFVALTFWAVWSLGRRILPGPLALVAVLPLLGVVYYGFTAPEFNHNVAQLPFFALVPLLLHRALGGAGGRGDRAALDWGLLGFVGGLALYAKYSTAPLLLAVPLLLLCHPAGWRALAGRGPWLALGVFLLTVLPHAVAVWSIDFLPLATPAMRAEQAEVWWQRLWFPLRFLAGQLLNCLGGLLILAALALPGRDVSSGIGDPRSAYAFDRFLVFWMFGLPIAIVLAYSVLAGQKLETMWGSPYFALGGLAGLLLLPREPSRRGVLVALGLGAVLFGAGLAGYVGKNLLEPLTSGKGMRAQFPGAALAHALERDWAALSGGQPLPTLVGDFWIAGNVATYGDERPPVFIEARPERSPWVEPDQLAETGAVFVWRIGEDGAAPGWLEPWSGSLCRQGQIVLPWQSWIALPPLRVAWATYGAPHCDRPPLPAGAGAQRP